MSNGEFIAKQEAKALIDTFQENNPNAIKASLYDKTLIEQLLNEQGTNAVRIYNGEDADGNHKVIFVCVDADGNDMDDNLILETGKPCPPYCDANSYFNS